MIIAEKCMAWVPEIDSDTDVRLVLDVREVGITDDQFFRLCRDNSDFRIEMTAEGQLIIMTPIKPQTGRKNAKITARLVNWSEQNGTGEVFDSSSEFTLPNGSKRSPDASWILKSRWESLPEEEKDAFSRICPDFVIELRSTSDRLNHLQKKMTEYMDNGCRLGWLLDPVDRQTFIYRLGDLPECIPDSMIL